MNKEEEVTRYRQLEKENAELKALVAKRDESVTAQTEMILNLKAENERLNKTLQEIKAIAEEKTKTYDYLLGQEYTDLVDEILQKITKAESEG